MKKSILIKSFLLCIFTTNAFASGYASDITHFLESFLGPIVSFLAFLFLGSEYEIFGSNFKLDIMGFPFLVAWLIIGGVFFTVKLRFVNFRLFSHALEVVRGKYDDEKAPGKVSHRQALFTAISATVGLGNIAGVAIAISIGGPGAVIWMMIAAFFGMSTKFAEVIMGQKYRFFSKDGDLLAGPFYYLEHGLREKGYKKLSPILSKLAAICCILGALGAGLMFQANQSVAIITDSFSLSNTSKLILVILIASIIAFILIGGIKRIAHLAEKIVPAMAIIYVVSCIIVLYVNSHLVPDAIKLMFSSAFADNALYGGIIGAVIQGFKRSAFSNEAGLGSAPIAHAAAKTNEPVREGCVALLEPFIDTIIICFTTGIVITVTGAYNSELGNGVLMTRNAFETVSPWFPYILSLVVFLFAFSTMLTYSYYGRQAWRYLTKNSDFRICYSIFIIFIFIGGMVNIGIIVDFADILFLSMAVPNLIGLYLMSNDIVIDMDKYTNKYLKKNKN